MANHGFIDHPDYLQPEPTRENPPLRQTTPDSTILAGALSPMKKLKVMKDARTTPKLRSGAPGLFMLGITDLMRGIGNWRLCHLMGLGEIRRRYARSRIGQFWLAISDIRAKGNESFVQWMRSPPPLAMPDELTPCFARLCALDPGRKNQNNISRTRGNASRWPTSGRRTSS
jgi:hypothetical protein